MAFLNGIFGGGNKPQQQAAPQQQQAPQGNQGAPAFQPQGNPQGGNQQQPRGNSNGSGGPASRMESQPNSTMNQQENSMNPMDPYLALMTPSQEVQQSQQNQQQPKSLFGQVTPEALDAHVKRTSFTDGIDPQKLQAAMGGDAQAFMEVLNSVGQNGFKASLQMSQGMVEHGVKSGLGNFETGLDSRFRDYQLKTQNSNNAALKHPLGKAMLSGIASQIAQANPKMSPTEVHAKAEEALSMFASQMAPQQSSNQSDQNAPQQQDWEAFLQ